VTHLDISDVDIDTAIVSVPQALETVVHA
jgi:hypothetical protein